MKLKRQKKRIALVAHDNRKKDLLEWVSWNRKTLSSHQLFCTGTTGHFVEEAMKDPVTGKLPGSMSITRLKSGPLGGDQQMGALVADGKIDMMIFFWDPMQQQAHDVDVKALLRITVLYNIPTASNRSTADFLISSEFFSKQYTPRPMDVGDYLNRSIDME
ncbi:MAG: methylglyoxal synthase [Bacteroides sp.]|jgi:methylglyoxal synthase|nr:methylglyoxal synthase [Bacteroides sp.]